MDIRIFDNEAWWGGNVNVGHLFPITKDTCLSFDLNRGLEGSDQFAPLLLSSEGRFLWSEKAFSVRAENGILHVETDGGAELTDGCGNLRGAYLTAMKRHFPFSGKMPDELFFTAPQYNTWIELGTDQTTDNILRYAEGILAGGLKPGVLMIDGGWQEDFGVFEFHARKVPDPKALIDRLHEWGFKVMLWVSPIVSSAGDRFKMLRSKGYLVRVNSWRAAVRDWWSGHSAVLDLTNPEACAWMHGEMRRLMELYGVDGYKFDAGDAYFYRDDDVIFCPMPARDHTTCFNEVGAAYRFNEFRAAYKFGGREIVARLHDKNHSWDHFGLNTLIGHTVMQGLLGYAYGCPDMVGGGQIKGAAGLGTLDEELYLRWVQANSLMGMMQLSIAPWRVLSAEHFEIAKKYIQLHEDYGQHFAALARHAAETGEPPVRCPEYQFPHEGLAQVTDEYMLGDDLLVAPVLEKGARERRVHLPHGTWLSDEGKIYEGGQVITESVPLDRLCYYKKVK